MSRQVSIAKLPLTIAAGAVLVALFECGTDPFAGQLYPAGAVPSSDAYGTDLTCLEQPCGNATFAIWNPDGSDLAQASYCQGGTVYWLCAVGRSSYGYGAYTCTDPASSGWTFGGCGSVAVDAGADALTFDAGIDSGAADLGNPCSEDADCGSGGSCAATLGSGFCTETCSSSGDCPSHPDMFCLTTASDNICFVECSSNDDCTQFGSAFTCLASTDVEGDPVSVCGVSADAG